MFSDIFLWKFSFLSLLSHLVLYDIKCTVQSVLRVLRMFPLHFLCHNYSFHRLLCWLATAENNSKSYCSIRHTIRSKGIMLVSIMIIFSLDGHHLAFDMTEHN